MAKSTESLRANSQAVKKTLATIQEHIGPQKYNAWFGHGTVLEIEDGHVKVTVPNPFVANWIEKHYQLTISEAAETHTKQARPVVVTIDPTLSSQIHKRQLDIQADIVKKTTEGRTRSRQPLAPTSLRYELKDFVVGESNKLAYSAALAAAEGKKPSFNPLFVHGSCGVGKTHLLQGICSAFSRRQRSGRPAKWKYVTGEQFTNEYIQAVRKKKFDEFRARYRRLDLLAIDDVHFLAAKKATQDEFLHTYDAIESAGRRVVMASDAHPHMVGDLNAQLVSRFVAGMVVKIDTPDRVTRLEIAQRKARAMKLKVSEEILEHIAMHVRGSVRELEGSLIKLAALAALEGGAITMDLATNAMADHLARTGSAVTLGDIEAVVATYFGITPADIHSSRRTRTVSLARHLAMFLARHHTRMSFPEIGRFMGKSHSSAVLAVQRMDEMLRESRQVSWMTPAGAKSMPARKLVKLMTEQFA